MCVELDARKIAASLHAWGHCHRVHNSAVHCQVFEGLRGARATTRELSSEQKKRRVVLKRVNMDGTDIRSNFLAGGTMAKGAAETGKAEAYMNSRIMRDPVVRRRYVICILAQTFLEDWSCRVCLRMMRRRRASSGEAIVSGRRHSTGLRICVYECCLPSRYQDATFQARLLSSLQAFAMLV